MTWGIDANTLTAWAWAGRGAEAKEKIMKAKIRIAKKLVAFGFLLLFEGFKKDILIYVKKNLSQIIVYLWLRTYSLKLNYNNPSALDHSFD